MSLDWSAERALPAATYRLQLTPEFDFAGAAAVVDYLADLGVSHIYCSPVLQAAPGSAHGYDVVDHGRLNEDLGGSVGFAHLAAECRRRKIGIVVDVVPNHLHIGPPDDVSAAWADVLDRGRTSPFAKWFDIEWDAPGADDGVLLPWRDADGRLNYRRFFDISSLAAVRVEDTEVFGTTHRLLLELTRTGLVRGLRIDHPDGLADPVAYLHRLGDAAGDPWVVVEKILEHGETLPADWRCAGTTGYDALNAVLGVLVDPAAEQSLTELYQDLTGQKADFDDVVDEAKRDVLRQSLAPEVDRLGRAVAAALDITHEQAVDAVRELLVSMPVYRAYVRPGQPVPPESRAILDAARTQAVRARPDLAHLLARVTDLAEQGPHDFVVRFQQTCGPVMAKGVEDTAFYRYHRFVALNEVGGDPAQFGRSVESFHAFCERLASDWPATMTTLSTHDTKRAEDVRARLAVVSEMPADWADAVRRWSAAAAPYRSEAGPDRELEYLLWQTFAGAWPLSVDRAVAYAEKASREAKQRTAWVDGDPAYDAAVRAFVEGVLGDPSITAAIGGWVDRITPAAMSNTLSQKLIQLTMPGVPDLYQGTEVVDLSLVDPDNRRPVDYDHRRALLAAGAGDKLRLVTATLRHRRANPEWYDERAAYTPMTAKGPAANHLIAFGRGDGAVTVATRLPVGLQRLGGWQETALHLPDGHWSDVLSGRSHRGGAVPVSQLLEESSVALLGKTAPAST